MFFVSGMSRQLSDKSVRCDECRAGEHRHVYYDVDGNWIFCCGRFCVSAAGGTIRQIGTVVHCLIDRIRNLDFGLHFAGSGPGKRSFCIQRMLAMDF